MARHVHIQLCLSHNLWQARFDRDTSKDTTLGARLSHPSGRRKRMGITIITTSWPPARQGFYGGKSISPFSLEKSSPGSASSAKLRRVPDTPRRRQGLRRLRRLGTRPSPNSFAFRIAQQHALFSHPRLSTRILVYLCADSYGMGSMLVGELL